MDIEAQKDRGAAVVAHFAAMIHGSTTAEQGLHLIAEALSVSTTAIGRVDGVDASSKLLVQNKAGFEVRPTWTDDGSDPYTCLTVLADNPHRDVLILQTRTEPASDLLRNDLSQIAPYLGALWNARAPSFKKALDRVRVETEASILHPDNPYGLTRAQLRICALIANGSRPQDMAKTLDLSITTIRTHLGQIYAKTGLDGMVGVIHHLQMNAETQARQ